MSFAERAASGRRRGSRITTAPVTGDGVDAYLESFDEILLKIKVLKSDKQKEITQRNFREASKVLLEAAIANAKAIDRPQSKTAIWKNIKLRNSPRFFTATGDLKLRLGVEGGALNIKDDDGNSKNDKLAGGDTYYWRMLEFGAEGVPAQPLLRDAILKTKHLIPAIFAERLKKSVDRAIRKLERGAKKSG